jgi:hypothetical protein
MAQTPQHLWTQIQGNPERLTRLHQALLADAGKESGVKVDPALKTRGNNQGFKDLVDNCVSQNRCNEFLRRLMVEAMDSPTPAASQQSDELDEVTLAMAPMHIADALAASTINNDPGYSQRPARPGRSSAPQSQGGEASSSTTSIPHQQPPKPSFPHPSFDGYPVHDGPGEELAQKLEEANREFMELAVRASRVVMNNVRIRSALNVSTTLEYDALRQHNERMRLLEARYADISVGLICHQDSD